MAWLIDGFDPYEKIKVLLQVANKDFDEQDIAPRAEAWRNRG